MWLANWLNELFSQQTFGRSKQAIRWPGRDSEGEVVADGNGRQSEAKSGSQCLESLALVSYGHSENLIQPFLAYLKTA